MIPKRAYFFLCSAALVLATPCVAQSGEPASKQPTAAALSFTRLTQQVQRNLDAGARIVTRARERLPQHDTKAVAEFRSSALQVRTADHSVRQKLATLQNASATDWPQARAALSASYDLFVESVARAERCAEQAAATTGAQAGLF
jgi:hypothetical protein